MRIRLKEEFRFPADLHAASASYYQPGDYTVKSEPKEGEFALTKDVADAAVAAGKAEDITGEARAPKD